MASVPTMASRRRGSEMLQKGTLQPFFASTRSNPSIAASDDSDVETEFEDDLSDFNDYAGRRSEDSYGKRSDTTISTFEELRTPAINEFKDFNFQLAKPEYAQEPKKIVGPTGPHLFRYSFESSQEPQIYVDWSPVDSPRRAGPFVDINKSSRRGIASSPSSDLPLGSWTPPQVAGWARALQLDESVVHSLLFNDISGSILKDLKFGDLKELGIESFGQQHQLWDAVRNLRGSVFVPPVGSAEEWYTSNQTPDRSSPDQATTQAQSRNVCSSPPSPEEGGKTLSRRRARRALRPDDVISPAESASIVAIEQLLPKPHHCSKGEDCPKWRRQQRQMARIAQEFPLELEQIDQANASSPTEVSFRPTSEAVPSVVASSDLLGPGLATLRLDEDVLRVVPPRDPQENVRQFLDFQHLNTKPEPVECDSSPYEMFPPLSPPAATQAPHSNLSKLPKLTIPMAANPHELLSADRTVVRETRSPVTAIDARMSYASQNGREIFRLASPASTMDIPVTALPIAPVARDESQSVPPNMLYGNHEAISRSASRTMHRGWDPASPITRPQTSSSHRPQRQSSVRRSQQRSRRPSFAMAPLEEDSQQTNFDVDQTKTPTADAPNFAGWMKKRKTKMLRHEWHENHFRLKGTRLAMHRNSKDLEALEYIDVDDFAIACSSLASKNKLGAAFKGFKISAGGNKKKDVVLDDEVSAFNFQLVPNAVAGDGQKANKLAAAMASASGSKAHHFAVKTRDERIDWMRELMLAKALKEKGRGCEVNVNGNMI